MDVYLRHQETHTPLSPATAWQELQNTIRKYEKWYGQVAVRERPSATLFMVLFQGVRYRVGCVPRGKGYSVALLSSATGQSVQYLTYDALAACSDIQPWHEGEKGKNVAIPSGGVSNTRDLLMPPGEAPLPASVAVRQDVHSALAAARAASSPFLTFSPDSIDALGDAFPPSARQFLAPYLAHSAAVDALPPAVQRPARSAVMATMGQSGRQSAHAEVPPAPDNPPPAPLKQPAPPKAAQPARVVKTPSPTRAPEAQTHSEITTALVAFLGDMQRQKRSPSLALFGAWCERHDKVALMRDMMQQPDSNAFYRNALSQHPEGALLLARFPEIDHEEAFVVRHKNHADEPLGASRSASAPKKPVQSVGAPSPVQLTLRSSPDTAVCERLSVAHDAARAVLNTLPEGMHPDIVTGIYVMVCDVIQRGSARGFDFWGTVERGSFPIAELRECASVHPVTGQRTHILRCEMQRCTDAASLAKGWIEQSVSDKNATSLKTLLACAFTKCVITTPGKKTSNGANAGWNGNGRKTVVEYPLS